MHNYWNIVGDRNLSESWTAFTNITILNEQPPDGCGVERRGLHTFKQLPDLICGLKCPACQKQLNERKSSNELFEKTKLANARKLRGINFLDADDKEFKETIQNARKKLELPMDAAMPCKLKTFQHRGTCGESNDIRKSGHACIVEADESTRKRLERTLPKDHEDHMAETGYNSLSHENLVHKFILCPKR